jgi:hypothetical protein
VIGVTVKSAATRHRRSVWLVLSGSDMKGQRTLEVIFDDDSPLEEPIRPWGEMAVVADPDDEDLPETVREPRSRPDPPAS